MHHGNHGQGADVRQVRKSETVLGHVVEALQAEEDHAGCSGGAQRMVAGMERFAGPRHAHHGAHKPGDSTMATDRATAPSTRSPTMAKRVHRFVPNRSGPAVCSTSIQAMPGGGEPPSRPYRRRDGLIGASGMGGTMLDHDRSRQAYLRRTALLLALPLMLTLCAPIANAGVTQDEAGSTPEAVWSDDYINHIFPWADEDDRILQIQGIPHLRHGEAAAPAHR